MLEEAGAVKGNAGGYGKARALAVSHEEAMEAIAAAHNDPHKRLKGVAEDLGISYGMAKILSKRAGITDWRRKGFQAEFGMEVHGKRHQSRRAVAEAYGVSLCTVRRKLATGELETLGRDLRNERAVAANIRPVTVGPITWESGVAAAKDLGMKYTSFRAMLYKKDPAGTMLRKAWEVYAKREAKSRSERMAGNNSVCPAEKRPKYTIVNEKIFPEESE